MYTISLPRDKDFPAWISSDLSAKQCDELHQRIRPMLHYLADFQRRMDEREWYADDRQYLDVRAARYAMQLLCKDLHRLACGPSYGGKRDA